MSQQIKLPLGSVDAVVGTLKMHVPLGPRLPGRIPLGFTWAYDSHDSQMALKGGSLRPVVWPGGSSSPLQVTVVVNGEPWAFYKQAKPAVGYDNATLLKWGGDRGVPTVGAEGTTTGVSYFPNTDGTRFFVTYSLKNDLGRTTIVRAVLTGDMAIWTMGSPDAPVANPVTHFTNRWGDHVTVNETVGAGMYGAPQTILIRNERYTDHTITLNIQGLTAACFANPPTPATITATINNNLKGSDGVPLPPVVLTGAFCASQRVNKAYLSWQVGYYTGIYDGMVMPNNITENALRTTSFNWVSRRLNNVNLPSGLVETFSYGDGFTDLDRSTSWDKTSGKWIGFRNQPGSYDSPYEWIVGPVAQVQLSGVGVGQCIAFGRVRDKYSVPTYTTLDNITTVLTYPSTSPGGDYRGVRFTHPSAWDGVVGDASSRAYLFATSAVIAAEKIHGNGSLDIWGRLIGTATVDATTLSDGWDLRCWSNPTGGLANGLPVNPVAMRTRTYAPGLPTKTVIAGLPTVPGARDVFGPTQTDDYTDGPTTPTIDANALPVWSDALSLPSAAVHRQGIIHRPQALDVNAMAILPTDDTKNLGINTTPALRYALGTGGALTPVTASDFGKTAYTYTSGLVTTVTGTRTPFTSTENRTYLPGQPLVTSMRKFLVDQSSTTYIGSGSVGTDYGYDASPFHWLVSETQQPDGRPTAYVPDGLGRVTSKTDPLGIVTTTSYDAWGRVYQVIRQAHGGVASMTTTYGYDPSGRWTTETITEGDSNRSLTTRKDFDSFGRLSTLTLPDGSTQTYGYTGFGEKISQSPMLKPGQLAWGNERWAYDPQGRLTDHWDTQGRPLLHIDPLNQPTWKSLNGILAVWTTTQDDRGNTRSEGIDLLGQKVAVVDQASQLSLYSYDKDGHLLQTQQGSQVRSYTYNDMGWLTSRTEPEEGTTSYGTFTILGTPTVTTQTGRSNARNNKFTTTLNGYLQPTQIVASGLEGTVIRTLTYDPTSRLLASFSEVQPYGTLTETYVPDGLYRPSIKTVSDGSQTFSMAQNLDAAGRVTSLTYPSGGGRSDSAALGYDGLGRLTTVTLNGEAVPRGSMVYDQIGGTAVSQALTFGNNAWTTSKVDRGELTQTKHVVPDGTVEDNALTWSAGGLLYTRGQDNFGYDALQRLTSAHVQKSGTGAFVDQTFTYDRYGNRASTTTNAAAGTLAPDSEALTWNASYPVGNDLPATISTAGGPLYTGGQYDDLGRLIAIYTTPGQSSTRTTWAYDPSGRVILENGTSYLLDGEGLRFKRTKSDGSITYTVYGFGREPLKIFDKPVAGSLTWRRTLVYGFGQLLSEDVSGQGTIYEQGDQVGSPNLISNAAGQLINRTKNLPFGERLLDALPSAPGSTRRFTNHEEDPDSNAIYFQARTYLAAYGKFAQVDPAYDQQKDDPESWNLYSYCTNNPVTHTDPDGRTFIDAAYNDLSNRAIAAVSGEWGGTGMLGSSLDYLDRPAPTPEEKKIPAPDSKKDESKAGVKEYNLTSLTGDDLKKMKDKIKSENPKLDEPIERPKDKDAATFFKADITVTQASYKPGRTEGSAGSVDAVATASVAYHFVVYWVSPNSSSKTGEATIRDHESRHGNEQLAAVERFNKEARATTLAVPAGRGQFATREGSVMQAYGRSEGTRLQNIFTSINNSIDKQ